MFKGTPGIKSLSLSLSLSFVISLTLLYQVCVGSLMYLSVMMRGDWSFAINQSARILNNPGPSHILAAKRILRYLSGTVDVGLTYHKNSNESNGCWHSRTESEFYSVSQWVIECMYLHRLMEQLGYEQKSPTHIAQDNMACIYPTQGVRTQS